MLKLLLKKNINDFFYGMSKDELIKEIDNEISQKDIDIYALCSSGILKTITFMTFQYRELNTHADTGEKVFADEDFLHYAPACLRYMKKHLGGCISNTSLHYIITIMLCRDVEKYKEYVTEIFPETNERAENITIVTQKRRLKTLQSKRLVAVKVCKKIEADLLMKMALSRIHHYL